MTTMVFENGKICTILVIDEEIILPIVQQTEQTQLFLRKQYFVKTVKSKTTSILQQYRRLRFDLSVDRSNVTSSSQPLVVLVSIGFTELGFTLDNSDGLYIVPLVDNFTHGATDAVNDGGVAVIPSINASRSGEWPLQTDMRAFTSVDNLSQNLDFMKFLLSDAGKLKWEQMGFVGLNVWDLSFLFKTWSRYVSHST